MIQKTGIFAILFGIFVGSALVNPNISSGTGSPFFIYLNVVDFGATGNGSTNDYPAIQNAIDSAAQTGSKVLVPAGTYNIANTLLVPGGVIIQGEGRGESATATPGKGTIIQNSGTCQTIRITGHNSGLRDLVIYDKGNGGALGGIEILADGSIVESVVLENILISGFTDGIALNLEAKNSGGITYCSFYDIRIRHAKTGILIQEELQSFVNSNSFYHGAISGGGFEYCLRVLGGNNNIFNGIIIEPYQSEFGHLVVEKGQISGVNIRIEGAQQNDTVPLIKFNANTVGSSLSGIYSGGLTIDRGDNFIDLRSGKSLDYKNSGSNLFINSNFIGVDGNIIPYWEVQGTGINIEVLPPEIIPDHNVLKLTIPAGTTTYLRPSPTSLPQAFSTAQYNHVNFGAYVKTNRKNVVTTTCKAPAGIATGHYHPGDSEWHMVGMTGIVDRTTSYNPKFFINNANSSSSTDIYITTPTLNFGNTPVNLEAKPITAAGGILTGPVSASMVSVSTNTNGFLTLPLEGNIFEVNGSNTTYRINHCAQDRFPKGTIIVLLFNDANAIVHNGAYIELLSTYLSNENSSLTLISLGDGTWREINRNN